MFDHALIGRRLRDDEWDALLSQPAPRAPRRLIIVRDGIIVGEREREIEPEPSGQSKRKGRPKGARNLTPAEREERDRAKREAERLASEARKARAQPMTLAEKAERRAAIRAKVAEGADLGEIAVEFNVSTNYVYALKRGLR